MALVYNLETDVRFQQGIERGIERGIEQERDAPIGKLLKSGLLNHEQIAETLDIPADYVRAIAQRLAN